MNFPILVFLIISLSCGRINDEVTAATENFETNHGSLAATAARNDRVEAPEEQIYRMEPYSGQKSVELQESRRMASTKVDSSNRKSKILRSLAFLAGLSVGGLAGAASSDVKTYAKFAPLNIGASRISPQLAAIYDPYPYATHPYVLATPLGFYPLWDPLRLHPINGVQSNFQPLTQNSQTLNLLDDNKPSDPLNNDEYVDEAKKIENVKTSSTGSEDTDKSAEFQVEDDRNAEEKMISSDTACNIRKGINGKQGSTVKSISRERENADGSLTTLGLRAINTTDQTTPTNATHRNTTQIPGTIPKNETSTTTMSTMENSTMENNETNRPFYGYYGGYPQNINHIDLTTESYDHKYHGYEHINYNLPSYDKPVNFYSDERYNYYPVPPVDSYPSTQFQREHIPDYHLDDFKKFLYASDNTPPFVNNDFRPVI